MTYSCFWDVNEEKANGELSDDVSMAFSALEVDAELEKNKESSNESWIDLDDGDDEQSDRRGSSDNTSLQAIMNAMIKKDAEEKAMEANNDNAKENEMTANAKREPSFLSKMMAPLEDEGMSSRNYERVSRRRGIENLLEQINNTDRYVATCQRSFIEANTSSGWHFSQRGSISETEWEAEPVRQRSFMEVRPNRHKSFMGDKPTRHRSFMESKSVRNLVKRNCLIDDLEEEVKPARQTSFRETKPESRPTRQTSFRESTAEVKPACRQSSIGETKLERRPTHQTSARKTTTEVSPVPMKQRSFFEIRDEVRPVSVKQRSFFEIRDEVNPVPVKQRSFNVRSEASKPKMPVKQSSFFQTKLEVNAFHQTSFDEPKTTAKQRSFIDIKSEVSEPKMPVKLRSIFQTKAEVNAFHQSSFDEPKTPVKQRSFVRSARDFARVAFEGITDELDAPAQERRSSNDTSEYRPRRSSRSGDKSSSSRASLSRRNTSYM